jgi:hypothetical protein
MPGYGPTIDEFKAGALHSGSKDGPVVTNPAQAKAIAVNQAKKATAPQMAPRKVIRKPSLRPMRPASPGRMSGR